MFTFRRSIPNKLCAIKKKEKAIYCFAYIVYSALISKVCGKTRKIFNF